jgi:hypothetical protein
MLLFPFRNGPTSTFSTRTFSTSIQLHQSILARITLPFD